MKKFAFLALAIAGIAFAQAESQPPIYEQSDDIVLVSVEAHDFTATVELNTLTVYQDHDVVEVSAQNISLASGGTSVAILTKVEDCEFLYVTPERIPEDVGWLSKVGVMNDQTAILYSKYNGSGSGGLAYNPKGRI